MATPLEDQILSGFRQGLEESSGVPAELIDELVSLVGGESAPSPEMLLSAIKSKIGDHSV